MTKEIITQDDTKTAIQNQAGLDLSDAGIASINKSMIQAQKLVHEVLEENIDYGISPGTNRKALWDPGASKIANAFNCYFDHVIMHSREDEEVISYIVQCQVIERPSGRLVATGLGGCSTLEAKYAYRWVRNPAEYGYSKEEAKALKYNSETKKFRVQNPEIEDLGNTILKMAAKRAEIDASQSLPGVGSALRKLFDGKCEPQKLAPNWSKFWGEVGALGLSEDQMKEMLGIKSLRDDWLKKGKGLNEAVEILTAKCKVSKPVLTEGRDISTIETVQDLLKACHEDFGLQPEQVYAELHVRNASEISDLPASLYKNIEAIYRPNGLP